MFFLMHTKIKLLPTARVQIGQSVHFPQFSSLLLFRYNKQTDGQTTVGRTREPSYRKESGVNNMLRSWKHIRADTKHSLTENPRRGVDGTQQGLQIKQRNLLQSKGEQPSSFLQAPPLQLLHSDFPLFHLNPSVKGNKHVCDICESNTSRRTLSAQCWQSSSAGKKKT